MLRHKRNYIGTKEGMEKKDLSIEKIWHWSMRRLGKALPPGQQYREEEE